MGYLKIVHTDRRIIRMSNFFVNHLTKFLVLSTLLLVNFKQFSLSSPINLSITWAVSSEILTIQLCPVGKAYDTGWLQYVGEVYRTSACSTVAESTLTRALITDIQYNSTYAGYLSPAKLLRVSVTRMNTLVFHQPSGTTDR